MIGGSGGENARQEGDKVNKTEKNGMNNQKINPRNEEMKTIRESLRAMMDWRPKRASPTTLIDQATIADVRFIGMHKP